MSRFSRIQFILLTVFLAVHVTFCATIIKNIKSTEETCLMTGQKCLLQNVVITRANFTTLVPKVLANFTGDVTDFEIISSKIELLNGDVCHTFRLLTKFKSVGIGIDEVTYDAFSACDKLVFLDLSGNSITTLPYELFENNKQLLTVILANNKLKEIDPKLLYPIWKLNRLELQNNFLQELTSVVFKGSKSIEVLKIYSNQLKDLDEAGFVKGIPNLRVIYLADNDFHCDRIKEMVPTFSTNNVSVSMFYDKPRTRTGPVDKVDGSPCIPDKNQSFSEMNLHDDPVVKEGNLVKVDADMLKDLRAKIEKLINDLNHHVYEIPAFVPFDEEKKLN